MMLSIKSNIQDYSICIEDSFQIVDKLLNIQNSYYVIDSNVNEIYGQLFQRIPNEKKYVLIATEENKILNTAMSICENITEIPGKRNVTLISFGGGIVQDITGFVASIMYRGINWIFVPTTLLAACDSCIGGKTSLNYLKYKNLLGTFFPPKEIYIFPQMFQSLTERDLLSGLGEVVKFNIMKGVEGLASIERDIGALKSREESTISKYVISSLEYKRNFVEIDEFDHNERVKLNFAHTFGHAVEVVSNYSIPHGTAVAIGMIMADEISFQRGLISKEIKTRIEKVLLLIIDIDINALSVSDDEFLSAMRKDKKQVDNSLTTVLITEYHEKSELCLVHNTSIDEISNAINHFREIYES